MTREAPTAAATSVADSPISASRSAVDTAVSVSGLIPFGRSGKTGRRPQRVQQPVDLVLGQLGRGRGEAVAVRRVLLELGPERRERERLEQVEHHALRDGVPDDLGVPCRRHRDHVDQVSLRPQPLQQPEAMPVRQVHVEQQEVDSRV